MERVLREDGDMVLVERDGKRYWRKAEAAGLEVVSCWIRMRPKKKA